LDYASTLSQDNSFIECSHWDKDETYTFKELYQAMAIYSANAATVAMAEAVAGSEPKNLWYRCEKKVEILGIKDLWPVQ